MKIKLRLNVRLCLPALFRMLSFFRTHNAFCAGVLPVCGTISFPPIEQNSKPKPKETLYERSSFQEALKVAIATSK